VFSTSENPQDAYNFYKSNSDLQVTSSSSLGSGTAYVGYVAFSGDFNGWVATVPYNNQTLIIAYLSQSTSNTTAAVSATAIVP
jgi:hypothetical protein